MTVQTSGHAVGHGVHTRRGGATAVAIVLLWLAGAAWTGASGRLAALPPAALGALVSSGVVAFGAALALSSRVRAFALAIDPRALVLVHMSRLAGLAFLVAEGAGTLPAEFALPAGWGDIAIAASAPLVAWGAPWRTPALRRAAVVWNVAGVVDLLYAVSTGLRLAVADAAQMAPMTALPLSMVPTFFVPLLLIAHTIFFVQLGRSPGAR